MNDTHKNEMSLDDARRAFERDYLTRLMRISNGRVAHAAKIAQRNRTELYKVLARHQLKPGMTRVPGRATASQLRRLEFELKFFDQIRAEKTIQIMELRARLSVRTRAKETLSTCAADRDGECDHPKCPQLRDGEPMATGRHCPLDGQGANHG